MCSIGNIYNVLIVDINFHEDISNNKFGTWINIVGCLCKPFLWKISVSLKRDVDVDVLVENCHPMMHRVATYAAIFDSLGRLRVLSTSCRFASSKHVCNI